MIRPTLRQAIERIHASAHQLVLEFAGAGSLALFWLHSVAGSSRTILEASDRYAGASLADLLGQPPEQAVAPATAIAMATAGYRRAMRLTDGAAGCLGVGCSAAITTDRVRRGAERCWAAVRDHAGVRTYGLLMTKGARSRQGQETAVSLLLLRAIAEACEVAEPVPLDLLTGEQIETSQLADADPIVCLLEGAARSATIYPDGRRVADAPGAGALLSGSFNPLHAGHEWLALAATKMLKMTVSFELPILNADKPPLGYAEIERRLDQFAGRYSLVLTRAPLFVEKAALFPGCVFVVGYDTAARLVEPRYYGGTAERDAALTAIHAHRCRFLVAGRAEGGVFRTLEHLAIPAGFRDLFVTLPERDFRVDLSSTELRALGK